jgi:hypothetical protein
MAFLSTSSSHHDIALIAANPPNAGNLIELYVGADERLWRPDPSLVANSDSLNL